MPNTVSTPSALRHSMMASTALTCGPPFSLPGDGNSGGVSLAAHEDPLGHFLIGPAAAADLVGERDDPPALVALAARLVALRPVAEGGDRPEDRDHRPDREPDPEGAALD